MSCVTLNNSNKDHLFPTTPTPAPSEEAEGKTATGAPPAAAACSQRNLNLNGSCKSSTDTTNNNNNSLKPSKRELFRKQNSLVDFPAFPFNGSGPQTKPHSSSISISSSSSSSNSNGVCNNVVGSTKPLRSNASGSFGLRRRYSFESFDLKRGSSSGSLVKISPAAASGLHSPIPAKPLLSKRLSCRVLPTVTTLEPIPPSPTAQDDEDHLDNDKLNNHDDSDNERENQNNNETLIKSPDDTRNEHENETIKSNINSLADPRKLSSAEKPLPMPTSASSSSSSSLEKKKKWKRKEELGERGNNCEPENESGAAAANTDEGDDDDDDESLTVDNLDAIFSSPEESVSFLLDEFFFESVVAVKWLKQGTSWLTQSYQSFSNNTLKKQQNPDKIQTPSNNKNENETLSCSKLLKLSLPSFPSGEGLSLSLSQTLHKLHDKVSHSASLRLQSLQRSLATLKNNGKSFLIEKQLLFSPGAETETNGNTGWTTHSKQQLSRFTKSFRSPRALSKIQRRVALFTLLAFIASVLLITSTLIFQGNRKSKSYYNDHHDDHVLDNLPSTLTPWISSSSSSSLSPDKRICCRGNARFDGNGECYLTSTSTSTSETSSSGLAPWLLLGQDVARDSELHSKCEQNSFCTFPSSHCESRSSSLHYGDMSTRSSSSSSRVSRVSASAGEPELEPESVSQLERFAREGEALDGSGATEAESVQNVVDVDENVVLKERQFSPLAQLDRQEQAAWFVLSVLFTVLSASSSLTLALSYLYHKRNRQQNETTTPRQERRQEEKEQRRIFVPQVNCNSNYSGGGLSNYNYCDQQQSASDNLSPSSYPYQQSYPYLNPTVAYPCCEDSFSFTCCAASPKWCSGSAAPGPIQGYQNTPVTSSDPSRSLVLRTLAPGQPQSHPADDQYCQKEETSLHLHPHPPLLHHQQQQQVLQERETYLNGVIEPITEKKSNKRNGKCFQLSANKLSGRSRTNNQSQNNNAVHNNNNNNNGNYRAPSIRPASTCPPNGILKCSRPQTQIFTPAPNFYPVEVDRLSSVNVPFLSSPPPLPPPLIAVSRSSCGNFQPFSYHHRYYFLEKFGKPEKVLFPLFWTALLVDFNFPNCSGLVNAACVAAAIKLISGYHHYHYFARFWSSKEKSVENSEHDSDKKRGKLRRQEKEKEKEIKEKAERKFFDPQQHQQHQAPCPGPQNCYCCCLKSGEFQVPRLWNGSSRSSEEVLRPASSINQGISTTRQDLLRDSSKITVFLWLYLIVIRRLCLSFLLIYSTNSSCWWQFPILLLANFLSILGLLCAQLCLQTFIETTAGQGKPWNHPAEALRNNFPPSFQLPVLYPNNFSYCPCNCAPQPQPPLIRRDSNGHNDPDPDNLGDNKTASSPSSSTSSSSLSSCSSLSKTSFRVEDKDKRKAGGEPQSHDSHHHHQRHHQQRPRLSPEESQGQNQRQASILKEQLRNDDDKVSQSFHQRKNNKPILVNNINFQWNHVIASDHKENNNKNNNTNNVLHHHHNNNNNNENDPVLISSRSIKGRRQALASSSSTTTTKENSSCQSLAPQLHCHRKIVAGKDFGSASITPGRNLLRSTNSLLVFRPPPTPEENQLQLHRRKSDSSVIGEGSSGAVHNNNSVNGTDGGGTSATAAVASVSKTRKRITFFLDEHQKENGCKAEREHSISNVNSQSNNFNRVIIKNSESENKLSNLSGHNFNKWNSSTITTSGSEKKAGVATTTFPVTSIISKKCSQLSNGAGGVASGGSKNKNKKCSGRNGISGSVSSGDEDDSSSNSSSSSSSSGSSDDEDDESGSTQLGSLSKSSSCGSLVLPSEESLLHSELAELDFDEDDQVVSEPIILNDDNNNNRDRERENENEQGESETNRVNRNSLENNNAKLESENCRNRLGRDLVNFNSLPLHSSDSEGRGAAPKRKRSFVRHHSVDSLQNTSSSWNREDAKANLMNCKGISKTGGSSSSSSTTTALGTGAKFKHNENPLHRRGSLNSGSSNNAINRPPTPPPASIKGSIFSSGSGHGGSAAREHRKSFTSHHHHKIFSPPPNKAKEKDKDRDKEKETKEKDAIESGTDAVLILDQKLQHDLLLRNEEQERQKEAAASVLTNVRSVTSSIIIPPKNHTSPQYETSNCNSTSSTPPVVTPPQHQPRPLSTSSTTSPVHHSQSQSQSVTTSAASSNVSTPTSQSQPTQPKRLFRSGSNQCFGVESSTSSSPILHFQQSSTPPQQLININHNQSQQQQDRESSRRGSIEKYLSSKMRRTSLPALPAQRSSNLHTGSAGVDTALLYEAHGLVTEMLLDQATLPANIVAGLKALATLLKPTSTSSIHYISSKPKPVPLTLSIDPDYTSDIDEIPYTGEKLSTMPKRNSGQGKKGVAANILRRMSTSTWTTTTSATGMPTLEPQPHTRRRRSASFRSNALASVISLTHLSSASVSAILSQSPGGMAGALGHFHHGHSGNAALQASHKARSFSANALFASTGPSHRRFSHAELSTSQNEHGQRKTLCSLHPLSPSDLTHLSALAASTGYSGSNAIKSASASVSAAGSNRSSPASTPIPSPIPSPVPSRDPSPCNHHRHAYRHRDSSSQDLGSSEQLGPPYSSQPTNNNNNSTNGSTGSLLYQQRNSPSQSTGNLLSLNNNNNKGSSSGSQTSAGGQGVTSPTSPTSCRHPSWDYSPPKVLFHSTSSNAVIGSTATGTTPGAVTGNGGSGTGAILVDGDSLGLLSGKNPDEDNCSTTSTLGDGPGPPDNSSGNSNSLRLSPVTFTLQEPPDINEPYFGVDEEPNTALGREDVVVTSDGVRFELQSIAVDPLLCRLHEWDYPIFDLERSSKTQILSHMCYKVFLETGLFETFRIPIQEFFTYFHALELGYRDKPYHNRMHASDVLHGVYYLTSQAIPGLQMVPADPETPSASEVSGQRAWFNVEEASYGIMGANFTSLELMALYVAAAMHDYDHPGRTNAFLVSTYAKEAILYNDRSVLENHHAAAAWSLLLSSDDCNFLKYLDKAEFKRFRFLVIEAILATDLKRHFEIVAEFNTKANEEDSPGIDWNQEDDRLLVMEVCIKLADINGPCKVHDIHVQWTHRIAEEFYEQGDEESELGLPISPFMDRKHPQLARLQESFINHLVAPLCKACAEAGVLPGYWIEDQEEDRDDDDDDEAVDPGDDGGEQDLTTADDLSIATTSCQETDNENDESSYSEDNPTNFCSRVLGGGITSKRRIFCLQTKHLQDNHRHWMNVIKQEEKKKEEVVQTVKTESVAISTEDPMETIEEENNTPHSLNRSFSFEKEDSKL